MRQQYYADPSKKHLEVYQNFSGGLNTVSAVHNLADAEMTDLINIDLSERGTLKRRSGMVGEHSYGCTRWSHVGHMKWSELIG